MPLLVRWPEKVVMTPSLPLLIATDQNLLFAAATTVRAAHLTLADGFELDVFAYVEGVPDNELARFSSFCEADLGLTPRLITDRSWSPEDRERMNSLAEVIPKLPRALWARLYLPSLVTDADRAVFLDIDVAVVGDLSPMWLLPLSGHAVGAVHDLVPGAEGQLRNRYPQMQSYLNAGVMAIDVAAWRSGRIAERVTEWILSDGRKTYFPDQDALNVVLMDQQGAPLWQRLDPIWNTITTTRSMVWASGEPRSVPLEEVRLRHFAGSFKPWNSVDLPLHEVFDEHLAAVPFQVPVHLRSRPHVSLPRRWVRRVRRKLRRR